MGEFENQFRGTEEGRRLAQEAAGELEIPVFPREDFNETGQYTDQLEEWVKHLPEEKRHEVEYDLSRFSYDTKAYLAYLARLYSHARKIGMAKAPEGKTQEVFAQPLQERIKSMCVGDAGEKIGNAAYVRAVKYLGIPGTQIYYGHVKPEDQQ